MGKAYRESRAGALVVGLMPAIRILRAAVLLALLAPASAHAGAGHVYTDADDCCWFFVTGYLCAPPEFPYCGIMASGRRVYVGAMACPEWMPMGMDIDIEGVGTRRCADLYAPGLSDRFDVFVASRAEAYAITGCHRWWPVVIVTVPDEAWYAARPGKRGHECDAWNWETPPSVGRWPM